MSLHGRLASNEFRYTIECGLAYVCFHCFRTFYHTPWRCCTQGRLWCPAVCLMLGLMFAQWQLVGTELSPRAAVGCVRILHSFQPLPWMYTPCCDSERANTTSEDESSHCRMAKHFSRQISEFMSLRYVLFSCDTSPLVVEFFTHLRARFVRSRTSWADGRTSRCVTKLCLRVASLRSLHCFLWHEISEAVNRADRIVHSHTCPFVVWVCV